MDHDGYLVDKNYPQQQNSSSEAITTIGCWQGRYSTPKNCKIGLQAAFWMLLS